MSGLTKVFQEVASQIDLSGSILGEFPSAEPGSVHVHRFTYKPKAGSNAEAVNGRSQLAREALTALVVEAERTFFNDHWTALVRPDQIKHLKGGHLFVSPDILKDLLVDPSFVPTDLEPKYVRGYWGTTVVRSDFGRPAGREIFPGATAYWFEELPKVDLSVKTQVQGRALVSFGGWAQVAVDLGPKSETDLNKMLADALSGNTEILQKVHESFNINEDFPQMLEQRYIEDVQATRTDLLEGSE